MTDAVFDVVPEDPEIEHVPEDVHPRCVHEHRGQKRQVDRGRPRVVADRDALPAGSNRLHAHEILVVCDLERNGAIAVNETLARAELDKPDENVCSDERVSDDRDGVAVRIVISERHYHVGSRLAGRDLTGSIFGPLRGGNHMTVLVAGATGVLGTEIVRRLRSRGHAVQALVRSTSAPEKVSHLQQIGATTKQGDLKDPASLAAACKGMEVVISTVSMILTAQPGDSFAATDGAGTVNLIDAARAERAGHFVFVSFDTSVVPECPLTRAKQEAEDHLTRSGLTYSILHPSLFMESWLGPMLFADAAEGTAKILGSGSERIRYIAVSNVAELAVQSLTAPAARNAIVPFGGPEEISQRDALRIFEEVYGKPFVVTEVPEQALEAQWNSAENQFDKSFSALMLGVARGLDSGMQPPYEDFPMEMVTVRDFVRNAARQS